MHTTAAALGFALSAACGAPPAPAEPAPSPPPPPAEVSVDLPHAIEALLAGGPWDSTPRGMRVIALSHIAEGCAAHGPSDAARACVTAALARAREEARAPLTDPAAWGGHGLYFAHLAVILGAAADVGAPGDDALYGRVATHLAAASMAAPNRHVASYPDAKERWPADQAVVLYALHRYDEAHHTDLVDAPLSGWLAWMDAHATDEATGLWWSEVTGRGATSRLPRGCATSWTIRYLATVAPERARAMWQTYTATWRVELGPLVGMREWPPGKDRPADIDSGPIVRGVGAAATAFALGAAQRVGDTAFADRLRRTAGTVQALSLADPTLSAAANSVLAQAIRYEAAREP